jgi:hypothetical protein
MNGKVDRGIVTGACPRLRLILEAMEKENIGTDND